MQRVFISAFLLLVSCIIPAFATDLWLYDHDDYDKHKTFKRFNFGTSQRCYNIADCFNDKASSASWINAPKASWLAFYDSEDCTGTQFLSRTTPSGEMKFAPVNLDNKISSFMQWEYATYPLHGFWDICNKATLLTLNSTANAANVSDKTAN
ncbi:hypothetical protein PHMEG_0004289 [Phytophthora megakarya]|uniref:Uncharacterized protein n=1 Tax=Phytophthora megakarya TaxID=4795 RepID=A0A225WU84_9STRA|nr:hypothetical protein PHMEG_0004289 [Phytophthora megakarya]